ncbi:MAG: GNAT family N-acetyltransferase [Methylovirgula sp.]
MPLRPRIVAKEIILDLFRVSDVQSVSMLLNDWDVVKWTASIRYPYSEEIADAWIRVQSATPANCVYAIRAGGALVGCVSCRLDTGEIGYWIGKSYWNRGYATEAVRSLVREVQQYNGSLQIWGACLPTNLASKRVMAKSGFVPAGSVSFKDRVRYNGEVMDRFMILR